jgi:hypothetical protein
MGVNQSTTESDRSLNLCHFRKMPLLAVPLETRDRCLMYNLIRLKDSLFLKLKKVWLSFQCTWLIIIDERSRKRLKNCFPFSTNLNPSVRKKPGRPFDIRQALFYSHNIRMTILSWFVESPEDFDHELPLSCLCLPIFLSWRMETSSLSPYYHMDQYIWFGRRIL